jgi:hypothetical protein
MKGRVIFTYWRVQVSELLKGETVWDTYGELRIRLRRAMIQKNLRLKPNDKSTGEAQPANYLKNQTG